MRNNRELDQTGAEHSNASGDLKTEMPTDLATIKQEIETALQRIEHIDAQRISILVKDNSITLTGDVKTWREHEAAGQAAKMIAGVKSVQNQIRVIPWMF